MHPSSSYFTAEALSDAEAVVGNAHCLAKIVEVLVKEVPIYQANPMVRRGCMVQQRQMEAGVALGAAQAMVSR